MIHPSTRKFPRSNFLADDVYHSSSIEETYGRDEMNNAFLLSSCHPFNSLRTAWHPRSTCRYTQAAMHGYRCYASLCWKYYSRGASTSINPSHPSETGINHREFHSVTSSSHGTTLDTIQETGSWIVVLDCDRDKNGSSQMTEACLCFVQYRSWKPRGHHRFFLPWSTTSVGCKNISGLPVISSLSAEMIEAS